jgi:hypothetical protein
VAANTRGQALLPRRFLLRKPLEKRKDQHPGQYQISKKKKKKRTLI